MDYFERIFELSSPMLLALTINLFVAGLKKWPAFPDTLLPLAAMALGAIGYPTLEAWTGRNVVLGLAIGGLSVAMNQQLRQWAGGSRGE